MTPTLSTLRDLERRLGEAKDVRAVRECEKLIAENIFGLRVWTTTLSINQMLPIWEWHIGEDKDTGERKYLERYCSSLDAAVALVEKTLDVNSGKFPWRPTIEKRITQGVHWHAKLQWWEKVYEADALTAPLALCLALIRALIAKQEERG